MDSQPWQLRQSPHTVRLMTLYKAGVAPRHCCLSTFFFHRQHPDLRRLSIATGARRMFVVLHIRSDRNQSGAAALRESACPQRVNQCRGGCPAALPRLIENGRARGAQLSDQAPADTNENKEPNHNENAGRGDAQCGSRHGIGELGAEPGAAAEACCEDHAQRQIKLAVNYITGGRSKRDWKLKDLTQTDTGE